MKPGTYERTASIRNKQRVSITKWWAIEANKKGRIGIKHTKERCKNIRKAKQGVRYGGTSLSALREWGRQVWEKHYNYKIPEGLWIHHRDGDVSNNNIENLVLLTPGTHLKVHGVN